MVDWLVEFQEPISLKSTNMYVCIYFYVGMSDSGTACTLTTEQQFRVHVVAGQSELLHVTSVNSKFKGGTLYTLA